jgi:hypothetical protein
MLAVDVLVSGMQQHEAASAVAGSMHKISLTGSKKSTSLHLRIFALSLAQALVAYEGSLLVSNQAGNR